VSYPGKEDALKAFDDFAALFEVKYPKATHCLVKDKDQMLRFYDFPAENWRHIRSTNVIESTFKDKYCSCPQTRFGWRRWKKKMGPSYLYQRPIFGGLWL
jgi:transposase-like protein